MKDMTNVKKIIMLDEDVMGLQKLLNITDGSVAQYSNALKNEVKKATVVTRSELPEDVITMPPEIGALVWERRLARHISEAVDGQCKRNELLQHQHITSIIMVNRKKLTHRLRRSSYCVKLEIRFNFGKIGLYVETVNRMLANDGSRDAIGIGGKNRNSSVVTGKESGDGMNGSAYGAR